MRFQNNMLPVIAAIFSNLVTLVGVLWFGWDVGWLLLLYGIESVVVGLFNIKKIQLASAEPKSPSKPANNSVIKGSINMSMSINGKAITEWDSNAFMWFFAISYGSLVLTLIILLVTLFPFAAGSLWGLLIWLAGVVVQYWIGLTDYISKYEFKKYSKAQQTLMPFTRLIALGIPVIVGISLQSSYNSTLVLMVMVGIKFLLDLLFILKPSTFILVSYGGKQEVISS